MTADPSDEALKLLYLDWCSSRVAKRFLELSVDEVWLRSDLAATRSPAPPPPTPPQSPDPLDRIPGYLDLVRRTAVVLARELDLPTFEAWKALYLQDPTAYQAEILGP
jgi:hypothetical protein